MHLSVIAILLGIRAFVQLKLSSGTIDPYVSETRRLFKSLERLLSRVPLPMAGTVIALLFVSQLEIFAHAISLHTDPPSWYTTLPSRWFGVLNNDLFRGVPYFFRTFDRHNIALFAITTLQTLALLAIYANIKRYGPSRLTTITLVTSVVFLTGFALAATSQASADIYAYISYSKLGFASYNPPNNPFSGAFAALNALDKQAWNGLPPCPYGPLWLLIMSETVGHASSLSWGVVMIRGLNLIAFASLLFSLRALRVPLAILAIAALNPAIFFYFIVDGHNDIISVAFIVGAMAARGRFGWLSFVLALAAGLVKLPYALVALLVFASEPSSTRRAALGAGFIVAVASISVLIGHGYINGLVTYHNTYPETRGRAILHTFFAAAAVIGVLLGVIQKRYATFSAFLQPAVFSAVFPWYIGPSIAYAVAQRNDLAQVFIVLPLATLLLVELFNSNILFWSGSLAIVAMTIFEVLKQTRRGSTEQIRVAQSV